MQKETKITSAKLEETLKRIRDLRFQAILEAEGFSEERARQEVERRRKQAGKEKTPGEIF